MKTFGLKQRLSFCQNIGFNDRQLRMVIGTLMIAMPMFAIPGTLGLWSISMLAAIAVITTAIVGWDPLYSLLGKTTYFTHEEEIQQRKWSYANIGIIDRAVRAGVGLTLLYALMTMSTMTTDMAFALMGIPLIVTAITAWDPIYATMGINSFGSKTDVEAAEPEANEQTLAELYEFPQNQGKGGYISRAA